MTPNTRTQACLSLPILGLIARILLISLIILLFVLLFMPKQELLLVMETYLGIEQSPWTEQESWFEAELWNAGHLLLFFLVAYILGSGLCTYLRIEALAFRHVFTLWLILVLIGLVIEYIQVQVGRSFAYSDVVLDGFGAAAGLCLLLPVRCGLRFLLSVLCVSIGLSSLIKASTNLYRMHDEFPVLFDHPDRLSLKRFSGNSQFGAVIVNGAKYLQVEFGTQEYSGIVLQEMKRDWSGYAQLIMRWKNPNADPLSLTCRIHDRWHRESGNATQDRFHQVITVSPGENHISFDLSKVQALPNNRVMDMTSIMALMCFTSSLNQPKTLLLQSVYLQ